MIKKIIMISVILLSSLVAQSYAVCQIKNLDACKADIGSGINGNLQNKLMPSNLDKLKMPKNTFDNRSQLGQPQIPENINLEPEQEENKQPYNSNCQFGNCINRGDTGDMKKR